MTRKIVAIVPAAGTGQRARATVHDPLSGPDPARAHLLGGDPHMVLPKQYRLLAGEPMLRWSVRALLADKRIDQVRVIAAPGDERVAEAVKGLPRVVVRHCGGPLRADTVMAGLEDAALGDTDWAVVHDAARPGLPAEALSRLIDTCLAAGQGGLLAMPVADTVKQARQGTGPCGVVARTIARDGLWRAQTPQLFPAAPLLAALRHATARQADITDEAGAMEQAGYSPLLVPGSVRNFKVTWPEDFDLMERWL
jgi:2-C-methyl-D-erythritol 4-phosphate cytidylyltransferase